MRRTRALEHVFAIEDTDARGLVPLADARERVAAADSFSNGPWREHGEHTYKDCDRLWAALLSLATAEEFAAQVMRLEWEMWPRGWERNTDPYDVFGDDVIALAEAATDEDGDLRDVCANVRTCALFVGTPRARTLVERVRSVNGDARTAEHFRRDWTRRHGKTCERAPAPLTAEAILRELDAAQERAEDGELMWPYFGLWSHSPSCHHVTRLVAAVRPETSEWCVLLDQITGAEAYVFEGAAWEYGTVPVTGWNTDRTIGGQVVIEPEDAPPDRTVVVSGPAGPLEVAPDDITDPLLRPEGVRVEDGCETLRLRVYLRHVGEDALPTAEQRVTEAIGSVPYVLIACTDRFRHDSDLPPSEQPTYRSLAAALASADPSLFSPGVSNTHFEDPERRGPDA